MNELEVKRVINKTTTQYLLIIAVCLWGMTLWSDGTLQKLWKDNPSQWKSNIFIAVAGHYLIVFFEFLFKVSVRHASSSTKQKPE